MEKIAIIAINKKGRAIAKKLKCGFNKYKVSCFYPSQGRLGCLTAGVFDREKFEGIIFIMAMGIVTRMITPHLKDKYRDPAVVVVDDFSRYAISALSGHEGGANNLAIQTANILDAEPVITTATEALKDTIIGIGCRKGIKKEDVLSGIKKALRKARCPLKRVRYLATIDLKAGEKGLLQAAQELGVPLRVISRIRISRYQGVYARSEFVLKKIGIEGVCEPCALLAGKKTRLILPKTIMKGLTLAIARED